MPGAWKTCRSMENILEIQNLSAGYEKDKPILINFSLCLKPGERVGIIGQNGCGKSTLAKALMGLTAYTSGKILWKGQELSNLRTEERESLDIGYLMQGGVVFENLTVEENLKFALLNKKKNTFENSFAALRHNDITMLQHKSRLKMKASFLSGGEKHILAFLMVIIANPNMKLLIADEPSAGIASGMQKELKEMIKSTIVNQDVSLILIEHNHNFLNELTERIIKIKV